MHKYDKPERARIFARTIASDILLYNRAKVEEAIKNDNVFEALEAEIEEGRAEYARKVTPEILEKYNLFERALVDKLLLAMGHVDSDIW